MWQCYRFSRQLNYWTVRSSVANFCFCFKKLRKSYSTISCENRKLQFAPLRMSLQQETPLRTLSSMPHSQAKITNKVPRSLRQALSTSHKIICPYRFTRHESRKIVPDSTASQAAAQQSQRFLKILQAQMRMQWHTAFQPVTTAVVARRCSSRPEVSRGRRGGIERSGKHPLDPPCPDASGAPQSPARPRLAVFKDFC